MPTLCDKFIALAIGRSSDNILPSITVYQGIPMD